MVKYVKRRIAEFFFSSIGIYILALFIPGFYVNSVFSAVYLMLFIFLLTFIFWPLMLRFTKHVPLIVFTVGSFFLTVFALLMSAFIIPGVKVSGLGLIYGALVVDLVTAIVVTALNIEDDDIYGASIYYLLKRRTSRSPQNSKTGHVFLQIDGLSEKAFREAVENGSMPTLAGWLKDGSHKIKSWETDLSSQTGASQAGILHGSNNNIPGFRWFDKSSGKILSVNGLSDASVVEKMVSNGDGLLVSNGVSIINLYTGDAKDNVFVDSAMKNRRQLYSQSWSSFYVEPFNFVRIGLLFLAELFREFRSRIRQRVRHSQPRLAHRGILYYLARAGSNVVLRELSTYIVIGNIISGKKDVMYTTFFGYDEVAHHCGVKDEECRQVLKQIDQQIKRIAYSKQFGKRPYQICVLSDHGQSNGATFKQRYGLALDQLVGKYVPETENIYQDIDYRQHHSDQILAAPARSFAQKFSPNRKKTVKEAKVVVLASGNLGLIYFTKNNQRMTLEEIYQTYPKLVAGLLSHEGISFIMVRSSEHGPLVLSAKGKYYLSDDKVDGENPLNNFEENTPRHLRRMDTFNNAPDLLIMSMYDPQKDEVAAFEELIGSHGGLGGNQSHPFILYPVEWSLNEEKIVGAEKLHALFKENIK